MKTDSSVKVEKAEGACVYQVVSCSICKRFTALRVSPKSSPFPNKKITLCEQKSNI